MHHAVHRDHSQFTLFQQKKKCKSDETVGILKPNTYLYLYYNGYMYIHICNTNVSCLKWGREWFLLLLLLLLLLLRLSFVSSCVIMYSKQKFRLFQRGSHRLFIWSSLFILWWNKKSSKNNRCQHFPSPKSIHISTKHPTCAAPFTQNMYEN